jgi:hypothetical protein
MSWEKPRWRIKVWLLRRTFHKFLGHPGIVGRRIVGALAYLQLGRAYVASASDNSTKSCRAPSADATSTKAHAKCQFPRLQCWDAIGPYLEPKYAETSVIY